MDDADKATEAEAVLLEARIRAARGVPGKVRDKCRDCGDDIPEERKKLALERCLPCARIDERRRAWYAPGAV